MNYEYQKLRESYIPKKTHNEQLSEKEEILDKYLSEMVFDDEPPQNQQAIKNNESRKTLDISIPNSPHKFSFKQKSFKISIRNSIK